MESYEGEKEFVLKLSYIEAGYLNAAVVEFFHKMKFACETTASAHLDDDRYKISKKLWDKVEAAIPIMDWT